MAPWPNQLKRKLTRLAEDPKRFFSKTIKTKVKTATASYLISPPPRSGLTAAPQTHLTLVVVNNSNRSTGAPAGELPPTAAGRRFSNPVLTHPKKRPRKRRRHKPPTDRRLETAAETPPVPPQPTRPPLFGLAKPPPVTTEEKIRRNARTNYAELHAYEQQFLPEKRQN